MDTTLIVIASHFLTDFETGCMFIIKVDFLCEYTASLEITSLISMQAYLINLEQGHTPFTTQSCLKPTMVSPSHNSVYYIVHLHAMG